MVWKNGGFLSQRPFFLHAQAPISYRDKEERLFLKKPIILVAFGPLQPCPFIFLVFGMFSVRTYTWTILDNERGSLVLWLSVYVNKTTQENILKKVQFYCFNWFFITKLCLYIEIRHIILYYNNLIEIHIIGYLEDIFLKLSTFSYLWKIFNKSPHTLNNNHHIL